MSSCTAEKFVNMIKRELIESVQQSTKPSTCNLQVVDLYHVKTELVSVVETELETPHALGITGREFLDQHDSTRSPHVGFKFTNISGIGFSSSLETAGNEDRKTCIIAEQQTTAQCNGVVSVNTGENSHQSVLYQGARYQPVVKLERKRHVDVLTGVEVSSAMNFVVGEMSDEREGQVKVEPGFEFRSTGDTYGEDHKEPGDDQGFVQRTGLHGDRGDTYRFEEEHVDASDQSVVKLESKPHADLMSGIEVYLSPSFVKEEMLQGEQIIRVKNETGLECYDISVQEEAVSADGGGINSFMELKYQPVVKLESIAQAHVSPSGIQVEDEVLRGEQIIQVKSESGTDLWLPGNTVPEPQRVSGDRTVNQSWKVAVQETAFPNKYSELNSSEKGYWPTVKLENILQSDEFSYTVRPGNSGVNGHMVLRQEVLTEKVTGGSERPCNLDVPIEAERGSACRVTDTETGLETRPLPNARVITCGGSYDSAKNQPKVKLKSPHTPVPDDGGFRHDRKVPDRPNLDTGEMRIKSIVGKYLSAKYQPVVTLERIPTSSISDFKICPSFNKNFSKDCNVTRKTRGAGSSTVQRPCNIVRCGNVVRLQNVHVPTPDASQLQSEIFPTFNESLSNGPLPNEHETEGLVSKNCQDTSQNTRRIQKSTARKTRNSGITNESNTAEQNISQPYNLRRPVTVVIANRQHTCNICPKSFLHFSRFKEHMKLHRAKKPFTCNKCEKRFTLSREWKDHMTLHTSENQSHFKDYNTFYVQEYPYKCNSCDKRYKRKSRLIEHVRLHTDERPYTCDVCKESFSWKTDMLVHMKLHQGKKAYMCYVCKKWFNKNDAGALIQHMRLHKFDKNLC